MQQLNALLPHHTLTSKKQWYHLLGSLCSAMPALAGNIGLFSNLLMPLHAPTPCIKLTHGMNNNLQYCQILLALMHQHPTHIQEIIPPPPAWLGVHDAAGTGLGSTFFNTTGQCHVWTHLLPQ
eukprot:6817031-Ditylum_brightwellii.AAC.1